MEEPDGLRRATELWQEAYRDQMDGELDRAMERYQRSIDVYPTAEAHTFLGWALSAQGRFDEGPPTNAAGRSRSTLNSAIHTTTSGFI
jgi:tetratricopeptide (TPR) repeat protein